MTFTRYRAAEYEPYGTGSNLRQRWMYPYPIWSLVLPFHLDWVHQMSMRSKYTRLSYYVPELDDKGRRDCCDIQPPRKIKPGLHKLEIELTDKHEHLGWVRYEQYK